MTIPVPKSRDQKLHVIPKVVVMNENEVFKLSYFFSLKYCMDHIKSVPQTMKSIKIELPVLHELNEI